LDGTKDGKLARADFIKFSQETAKSILEAKATKDKEKLASSPVIDNGNDFALLTVEEREVHEVFKIYDKNGDGVLGPDELLDFAQFVYEKFHPDMKLTGHDLIVLHNKMFLRHDVNGDGHIDFKEFYKWYSKLAKDIEAFEKLKEEHKTPVYNITQANERAYAKFSKYDADKSGYLERKELTKLADWVLVMFHPGKEPISHSKKIDMREKLLDRLDDDHNGKMDFNEFFSWFEEKCREIENFRKRKAKEAREKEEIMTNFTQLHPRLRKKFDEFDTDRSGTLEGKELTHLAEWVFTLFHPNGEMLSHSEKISMREKLMHRIDENHDGKLGPEEFSDWCENIFKDAEKFLHARALQQAKASQPSATKEASKAQPKTDDVDVFALVKLWNKETTDRAEGKDFRNEKGGVMRGKCLEDFTRLALQKLPPHGIQVSKEEADALVNYTLTFAELEEERFLDCQRFSALYENMVNGYANWAARRDHSPAVKAGDSVFCSYLGALLCILIGLCLISAGDPDGTIQALSEDMKALVAKF